MTTPTEKDVRLYGDEFDYSQKWEVAGVLDAARHARKAAVIAAELDDTDGAFKAEMERLREHREDVLGEIRARLERHEEALAGWHIREVQAGRRTKTVTFPTGVSRVAERMAPSLDVHDPAGLRAWIQSSHPEMEDEAWPPKARRDDEVLKRALLELFPVPPREGGRPAVLFDEDGERVPGVNVIYPGFVGRFSAAAKEEEEE